MTGGGATSTQVTVAPRWWRIGVIALVTAATTAAGVGSVVVASLPDSSTHRRIAAVLTIVALVALLLRRRRPAEVLAAVVAVGGIATLIGGQPQVGPTVVTVVALYTYGTSRPARPTLVAAAATAVVFSVASWAGSGHNGVVVPEVFLCAAVTAVSLYVRSQRELFVSYRERAEAAEREQSWASTRAVAAERVRIARELHDVVAHHVSLLVVQAGAVRENLPAGHLTRPVLDSMIAGGRLAMTELRDMLDALRFDERTGPAPAPAPAAAAGARRELRERRVPAAEVEGAPRAPQPAVTDVPTLVAGAVAAGQPVILRTEGVPRPLDAGPSLAAYRIVQEALTNAVRHAPGAFTVVTLAYDERGVDVSITNGQAPIATVAAPGAVAPGAGHGLEGMRERAALAHGLVTVGPSDGGWSVVAHLPALGASTGRGTVSA